MLCRKSVDNALYDISVHLSSDIALIFLFQGKYVRNALVGWVYDFINVVYLVIVGKHRVAFLRLQAVYNQFYNLKERTYTNAFKFGISKFINSPTMTSIKTVFKLV